MLRDPNQARWLFYAVILITLVAKVRPWKKLAAILGGLVAFGYAVHAIVAAVWPSGNEGRGRRRRRDRPRGPGLGDPAGSTTRR